MPIINFSNPRWVLVGVVLYLLLLILSREVKNSGIMSTALLSFLALTSVHCAEYITVDPTQVELTFRIFVCMIVDLTFIFLYFISYLWMDEIEAREKKLKSIDDSLKMFWKKV